MSFAIDNKSVDEVLAVVYDRVGPERFPFLLELPPGQLLALMRGLVALPHGEKSGCDTAG